MFSIVYLCYITLRNWKTFQVKDSENTLKGNELFLFSCRYSFSVFLTSSRCLPNFIFFGQIEVMSWFIEISCSTSLVSRDDWGESHRTLNLSFYLTWIYVINWKGNSFKPIYTVKIDPIRIMYLNVSLRWNFLHLLPLSHYTEKLEGILSQIFWEYTEI